MRLVSGEVDVTVKPLLVDGFWVRVSVDNFEGRESERRPARSPAVDICGSAGSLIAGVGEVKVLLLVMLSESCRVPLNIVVRSIDFDRRPCPRLHDTFEVSTSSKLLTASAFTILLS